jgi:3-oxoacyl-(acyl-carrier-protein) synthase
MARRVVITGQGIVSPLGSEIETFWTRLTAGESGIGPVTRFDTSKFDTRFAGEVREFRAEDYMDRKEIRRADLFVQYAIGATAQAVKQAGVSPETVDVNRYGVIVGSGIGGIATFEDQHRTLLEKGPSRVSPFFIPMMISDMASGQVSIQFGAKGPQLRHGFRLLLGGACRGRRVPDHPMQRGGPHDLGRRGGARDPSLICWILLHEGDVHTQRRSAARLASL